MISLFRRWMATIQQQYINPLERRRALGLTIMNGVVMVAWALGFIALNIIPFIQGETLSIDGLIPFIITPILIGAIQFFVLNSRVRLASQLFVGLILVSTLVPRLEGINGTSSIILVIPVLAAGLLLNRRDLFIVIGLLLFGIFFAAFNQTQTEAFENYLKADRVFSDLTVVMISVGLSTAFMVVFSGTSEAIASDLIGTKQRLTLLQAYRRNLSNAQDEDDVLVRTAELVSEKLLYTYTQLHLADAEDRLFTHVRTGMGTRHTVSQTTIDADSAVRLAHRRLEPLVITPDAAYAQRSHLLPSITYAIVLPLIVGEKSIGVLDIQSNAVNNPFRDNEIPLLQLIALDLAQALSQVRSRNELQAALQERRLTAERLETQVVDLQNQMNQNLGSDWTRYIQGRGTEAFGFDLGQNLSMTRATDLPEHLKAAMARGETVVEVGESEQVVNIPIMRRDDVLGAMSFGLPLERRVTERQLDIARAVTDRLTVALENARLVEQSQAQAARERKASEVSSQLLGQQEVDALLATAAESFSSALGAIYTRIYIEPDPLLTPDEEAL